MSTAKSLGMWALILIGAPATAACIAIKSMGGKDAGDTLEWVGFSFWAGVVTLAVGVLALAKWIL